MKPNFLEEKKLWKQGCNMVAGLDEAGRGPLAGPVVAAAVVFDKNFSGLLKNIKDSKQLNKTQREELYNFLTNNPQIKWAVGIVSEKIIDKINILEATKLAMKKAAENLPAKPGCLLLDGNFKIYCATKQKSIIKGDQKVISISAASIIAKVTRDRLMEKYHKKYPKYGFLKHKGYGTASHMAALLAFGPCDLHRKSFYPVSQFEQ